MNDKILRIKRPVIVSFIGHVDRLYEWISYIREGCLRLRHETDISNERGIVKAIYCNECDPMGKDYTKTHKRPEGPMDHFKNEMSTIEDADKSFATHRAAMEKYAKLEQAKARQARGERSPAHHPQPGRYSNRQPFNSGRGRGRERSRDDRDRRSRDDTRSSLRRSPRNDDCGHSRSEHDQNRGRDNDRGRDHNCGRNQGRGRNCGRDRGRNSSRDAHALDEGRDRSRSCSRDRDNRSSSRSHS